MGAILAFQAIERCEPVFDFGQALGRGLNAVGVVAQALANMAAAIPEGLWTDLKSAGLLRSDAPVPSEG